VILDKNRKVLLRRHLKLGPENSFQATVRKGGAENLRSCTSLLGVKISKFYKAKSGGILNAKFCNYGKM
jgi:hypothetical protein